MLREERPQTRPAKKTFFSDRHTPHSALTAHAFAPVIASIRTSLRTDINNIVSGVGTQLQAKMDAISACATNHGYNSAGIATRTAYDTAKSAYDTAKTAVQTAKTDRQ